MSDSRPTPPPRATAGDGTDATSGPSSRPPQGLGHDLARWSLAHPKWITTLAVLGFVAFCGWKAWAAFQQVHAWTNRNGAGSVPDDPMDRTSMIILYGTLAWFYLSRVVVRGKPGSMKWSGWTSRSFDERVRERITRGVPIRNGVLLAYALFDVAGLGLGLAMLGQWITLLLWVGSTAATLRSYSVWAPLVSVLTVIYAARLLWEILIQAEWNYFVGDRRAEVAVQFLRDEAAQREEELEEKREEARTSVGVWSWAVLVGGFVGGMLLSSRLPESEQGLCILSALAGLVAAGIAVYVARTKPRGSAAWLALVTVLFAGALVYCWHAFDLPTARSLLLGVMGGVTVGTMFTVLYLRKIEEEAWSLYREATGLEVAGRTAEALVMFQQIIDSSPNTAAAQDARKSIDALRTKLS